jgi:N-methylhydantoinase B
MPDAHLTSGQTVCDPVTLEIVRGAIRAAQAEMEALIERTAISAFIREKKDFYTALFDADGVMAVGSNLPVFGDICGPVFRDFAPDTMKPGDLYWYNDCYGSRGAISHSNDQVLVAPVFHDGKRCGFVMGWAHFSDIGGMRAGSISPDTSDIFQEGIIVPPTKLIDAGTTNEATLKIFFRNSRFPEQNMGDMRALMASAALGVKRIEEIVARFGAGVVADALSQLVARTRKLVRSKLAETFDYGTHKFTDAIDSDGHGNGPFHLRRGGGRAEMQDPAQVCNAGGPQALDEVKLREGSLLWPKWPAPLGMRGLTLMRFLAAVNGLINVAGGKAPAAHSAYVISFLRGTYRTLEGKLEPFLMSDGLGVGWGARATADGPDAVYFVAQENYPVEFLETGYPVRLRTYGILTDSCGAGRWRGGCGIVREYDILAEEAMLAVRIDSVKNPPWGMAGGMAGGAGRVVVNPGTNHEQQLQPLSDGNMLKRGDVLRIETGGGGGYGHPFDRPTESVLDDVLGGFVTAGAAKEFYGVAIDDDTVDPGATRKLRAKRPEVKAFHRHGYVDSLSS